MGKKKDEESDSKPVRKSSIGDIVKNIKKKYGDDCIAQASKSPAVHLERIPSGIYGVDKLLEGGWPLGRLVQIYGKESAAKTTTLLHSIANAQRYCRHCLRVRPERIFYSGEPQCKCKKPLDFETMWLDVEGVYDADWSEACGVNNDMMWVTQPDNAEDGLDIVDGVVRDADAAFVVIDTLTMLTPKADLAKSMDEDIMALRARKINRFIRRIVSAQNEMGMLAKRRLVIFLVCHINIGIGGYHATEEKAGGKTKEYANSFELRFKKCSQEAVGIGKMAKVECVVKKTKITSTFGDVANYHLVTKDTELFTKGTIDETPMLFRDSIALETIFKVKKEYRVHPKAGFELPAGITAQDNVQKFFHENRDEYECMKRFNLDFMFGDVDVEPPTGADAPDPADAPEPVVTKKDPDWVDEE